MTLNKYFLLFTIFSTLSLPSLASSDSTIKLNLSISNSGKFDVVYWRFKSANTGAIIGGLIGATIESGVRKSQDGAKVKELSNLISDTTCKDRLINSFIGKVSEKNFSVLLDQKLKINKKSKLWLEVKMLKCGFKMVNRMNNELAAFVEYKLIIKNKNKLISKKKYSVRANNQYIYEDLVKGVEVLNKELELVLKKAGKRLANKIIYQ